MKYKILFFLFLTINFFSFSQNNNFSRDSTFINYKITEFNSWLVESNLSNLIKIKNVEISEETIKLNISIERLSEWKSIRLEYDSLYNVNFGNFIFSKIAFLLEVPAEALLLNITSTSNDIDDEVDVDIRYLNGRIQVTEPITIRGGEIINIKLVNLACLAKDNFQSTTDNIKLKIKDFLVKYYSDKGIVFGKANCRIMDDENQIIAEVSNISREILYDCGLSCYFEMIRINITINKNADMVELNYNFQGKYGSGIFVAPRKFDYKDMELCYKPYLDEYQNKFKSEIRKLLIKK